jgi:hypothetical protein
MTILSMYRGDDRTLTITADESLTGSEITFTAKRRKRDDSPVLISKTTTDGITIGGDPDTSAIIALDAADIDPVAERVSGSEQRQHGSASLAAPGGDRHAAALGEPARPGADRGERQPAVVLERADHRAERVEVRDQSAARALRLPGQVGANRTATRELKAYTESFELFADAVDDAVGEAARARHGDHAHGHLEQIVEVDVERLHRVSSVFLVCGKR